MTTTLRFRSLNRSLPGKRLALRVFSHNRTHSGDKDSDKRITHSRRNSLGQRKVMRYRPSVRTLHLDTNDRDRLLRQQSLFCAQQGDFTTALSGMNLLLMRYPNSAADYNNRGLVHFQAGQWASALADYDKAIELDDNLADTYNNRANYHAAQGNLFTAIADYQTAIELDPGNIRVWINQGITFRELEMYIPALDNFEEALALMNQEEDHSVFMFLSAHLYAERGRANHLLGDWNCAMSNYYEAIAYLNHDSQSNNYPPLWWQVDAWLGELIKLQMEVPEWGN